MEIDGVLYVGWTRAAAGKNKPSRAIAKYTRGPANVIALTLARRLMIEMTPMMSPARAPRSRSAATSSTLPLTVTSSPIGIT